MAEDMTSRLLGEQRKRLVASIMGAAEQSAWWHKLSSAEQTAYREKVRSSIGTFYDFCRDVIKVTGDDTIRNDYALQLLNEVHAGQKRLERGMRAEVAAAT